MRPAGYIASQSKVSVWPKHKLAPKVEKNECVSDSFIWDLKTLNQKSFSTLRLKLMVASIHFLRSLSDVFNDSDHKENNIFRLIFNIIYQPGACVNSAAHCFLYYDNIGTDYSDLPTQEIENQSRHFHYGRTQANIQKHQIKTAIWKTSVQSIPLQ